MVIPQIKEDSNELQSKTYGCIIIVIITIHVKDNTCQGNPKSETAAPLYPKKKKKKQLPLCVALLCQVFVSKKSSHNQKWMLLLSCQMH